MSTAAVIKSGQGLSILTPQLGLESSTTIHIEEVFTEAKPVTVNQFLGFTDRTNIQHVPIVLTNEGVVAPALTTQNESTYIVNSPYLEPEHQLDLSTLNVHNRLFAQALTVLNSATLSFATTTYKDSLNWPVVFAELTVVSSAACHTWKKQDFYVVEFRSKLKADIDRLLLFKLDKESHREATASGGLLKYWFGEPDSERSNLATCLWRSKEDAVAGGKGPWHKQARSVIPEMYEKIEVKGLKLTIEDDVTGWSFEPWV